VSRILLIGMMGAGKTTVGRLLADRLGCPYVDSDAAVESATGRTVPELFETEGEAAFRAAESAALAAALTADGPVVVAVAGGAVLDPANRDLLSRSGTVVWLRAEPATLAARLGDGAGRPLLDGDADAAVDRLDRVRRPLYDAVADVTVDVDGLTPVEVADQVLKALAC
jgi:shikimate kinase